MLYYIIVGKENLILGHFSLLSQTLRESGSTVWNDDGVLGRACCDNLSIGFTLLHVFASGNYLYLACLGEHTVVGLQGERLRVCIIILFSGLAKSKEAKHPFSSPLCVRPRAGLYNLVAGLIFPTASFRKAKDFSLLVYTYKARFLNSSTLRYMADR